MLQISADQVYAALPVAECIDVVERAMIAISRGQADLPLRWLMPLSAGNAMGIMPGALKDPAVHGVKLICLYPGNPQRGFSSHQGVMLLFDTDNGAPLAAIDAASLTALRTAAATAAATRGLARAGARTLAILGSGEQADHHLPALMCVCDFEEVRVWSRAFAHAEAFSDRHKALTTTVTAVATAEAAVLGADVIVTLTASATPVLLGAWLSTLNPSP